MVANSIHPDKVSLPGGNGGAFSKPPVLPLVPELHLGTHYLGSCAASALADSACEGGTLLEAQLRRQGAFPSTTHRGGQALGTRITRIHSHRGNFSLTVASRPQQTWDMQIHIARDGKAVGPFSLEEVNRQLAAGTLTLSDQAWYEGSAGWAPLSTVPGVSSSASIGSTAASPPSPDATTPSVPVVTPPPAGGPVTAIPPLPLPNEPLAVWSLVLSLLAVCGFCCTPVGITAIGGVVCGHLALSRINANPRLQGHGLAVAGLIIGYCAIAGWLLKVLVFGGLAATEILKNMSH